MATTTNDFGMTYVKGLEPREKEYHTPSVTEELLNKFLEFKGKNPYEEFPVGSDLRKLINKMDSLDQYYHALSKIESSGKADKTKIGSELSTGHSNLEQQALQEVKKTREEFSKFMEDEELLDGFQLFNEMLFMSAQQEK